MFCIDTNTTIPVLQNYLHDNDWLHSHEEEVLSVEKPGEGNMNVVLRVKTNQRSLIVKQSRPFVQKYQQINAPLDRIEVEYEFYKTIKNSALSAHIPKVLGYDPEDKLLVLEDLGQCQDMSLVYKTGQIDKAVLQKLVFIASLIHKSNAPHDFPENIEMRQLNYQHVFELPFKADNGFNLDDVQPGLQEISEAFKTDKKLKKEVAKIGKKYLQQGTTLIHGDYYPGSWLTEANNLYVIDPEFGFKGFAEFDLGVMAAHLIMATGKRKFLNRIHDLYDGKANKELMQKVAGIEIIRRIIGLAQLPLEATLEEKRKLLKKARKMILAS